MARLRSSGRITGPPPEIERYYRDRLRRPARPPWKGLEWQPITLGPVWRIGKNGRWILPAKTLGWGVLSWCSWRMQNGSGEPWVFTDEQARFILHWYAIDDVGLFLYRDGVLQRLKGWGKDPIAACLCAAEAFGPVRFDRFLRGTPIGREVEDAWVQSAAVSLEQTKNTLRLFPSMFTPDAKADLRLQIGKTIIYGLNDTRVIEAVTSSPSTLEGARSTFVEMNETHHWNSSNEGLEMADVIERNTTKSPDGAARTLRITNAYEPGGGSVAERDRDTYEEVQAGTAQDTGLLYDSLEAAAEAPLSAAAAPAVVESIRGDSVWLNSTRIVSSIMDKRNPPSRSRRFWYNQITATEDAWITRQEYDRLANPDVVVPDGEIVTLGFDGSKTDDHSALIACSVELGHYWPLGIWVPPTILDENGQKTSGEVPTREIDAAVRQAHDRYDVVGFFSDRHPWQDYTDTWEEDFGAGYCVSASGRHRVAWDMAGRQKETTAIVEGLHDAIIEGSISTDGSSLMAQHFYNGRRAPNAWGITVRKEHRESSRKIDSIPATALAREARRLYLSLPKNRRRRSKTGNASFL